MVPKYNIDWGAAPDWLVAILAGIAAAIAWHQLRAAAQSAKDQAQIARATLILQIDLDFESKEMQECRLALRGLRNEIESFVRKENTGLHNSQFHSEVNTQFSKYLNLLWDDFRKADKAVSSSKLEDLIKVHLEKVNLNPVNVQPYEKAGIHYQRLTKIFGWLERVGHMANQNLLPKSDIISLYDFVFVELGGWFDGHIKYRREDGPLKNPEFLVEMTKFREMILENRTPPIVATTNSSEGVTGFAGPGH